MMTILNDFFESDNEEEFLRELDADSMDAFIMAVINDDFDVDDDDDDF